MTKPMDSPFNSKEGKTLRLGGRNRPKICEIFRRKFDCILYGHMDFLKILLFKKVDQLTQILEQKHGFMRA